jgi:hypothetical protein|uniref:Uncharacterized protein n=1 Tax=viral metagenome TaxID=1070528 RepID=A0A6C0D0S6_9ZZZZ
MDNNKETLSRLKFIGKIQKSEKINTKYLGIQQEGVITKLLRTLYYQDNRANTLIFLQSTIQRAMEILKLYEKSDQESDRMHIPHIVHDLYCSKAGLENIKETYSTDVKLVCDIEFLIQYIDSTLCKYPETKEEETSDEIIVFPTEKIKPLDIENKKLENSAKVKPK